VFAKQKRNALEWEEVGVVEEAPVKAIEHRSRVDMRKGDSATVAEEVAALRRTLDALENGTNYATGELRDRMKKLVQVYRELNEMVTRAPLELISEEMGERASVRPKWMPSIEPFDHEVLRAEAEDIVERKRRIDRLLRDVHLWDYGSAEGGLNDLEAVRETRRRISLIDREINGYLENLFAYNSEQEKKKQEGGSRRLRGVNPIAPWMGPTGWNAEVAIDGSKRPNLPRILKESRKPLASFCRRFEPPQSEAGEKDTELRSQMFDAEEKTSTRSKYVKTKTSRSRMKTEKPSRPQSKSWRQKQDREIQTSKEEDSIVKLLDELDERQNLQAAFDASQGQLEVQIERKENEVEKEVNVEPLVSVKDVVGMFANRFRSARDFSLKWAYNAAMNCFLQLDVLDETSAKIAFRLILYVSLEVEILYATAFHELVVEEMLIQTKDFNEAQVRSIQEASKSSVGLSLFDAFAVLLKTMCDSNAEMETALALSGFEKSFVEKRFLKACKAVQALRTTMQDDKLHDLLDSSFVTSKASLQQSNDHVLIGAVMATASAFKPLSSSRDLEISSIVAAVRRNEQQISQSELTAIRIAASCAFEAIEEIRRESTIWKSSIVVEHDFEKQLTSRTKELFHLSKKEADTDLHFCNSQIAHMAAIAKQHFASLEEFSRSDVESFRTECGELPAYIPDDSKEERPKNVDPLQKKKMENSRNVTFEVDRPEIVEVDEEASAKRVTNYLSSYLLADALVRDHNSKIAHEVLTAPEPFITDDQEQVLPPGERWEIDELAMESTTAWSDENILELVAHLMFSEMEKGNEEEKTNIDSAPIDSKEPAIKDVQVEELRNLVDAALSSKLAVEAAQRSLTDREKNLRDLQSKLLERERHLELQNLEMERDDANRRFKSRESELNALQEIVESREKRQRELEDARLAQMELVLERIGQMQAMTMDTALQRMNGILESLHEKKATTAIQDRLTLVSLATQTEEFEPKEEENIQHVAEDSESKQQSQVPNFHLEYQDGSDVKECKGREEAGEIFEEEKLKSQRSKSDLKPFKSTLLDWSVSDESELIDAQDESPRSLSEGEIDVDPGDLSDGEILP